jgi:hypothetical protein
MIEQVLIESVIKQAPALALMVLVVFMFLRAMGRMTDRFNGTMERVAKQYESNVESFREIQSRSIDAIIKNAEVLGELKTTIQKLNNRH